METPIVKLDIQDLETVYEPSEDSFLLIDALEADFEKLKKAKPVMCLEIGSGSGVVITALAKALNRFFPAYFMAVDINSNACRVTKRVGQDNLVDINVLQMDLINLVKKENTFDVVIFNPPYVVTESLEVLDQRLISKTWAGGIDGREVMDMLFPHIPNILSNNGLFYLVTIKQNDPISIINVLKQWKMSGEIICDRKIRGEHLYILRFVKITL
ncbi:methyltransferase N6AMT1 [Neodiprion pinetum]|uniref:methyltransferase N6AMT1 n=1 Tax=Neodiprion pinetum TaxID=441929 RepID=UPI001EDE0557|nr:methyltransferase N6AMT1 [Neodiprion pinetum]